MIALTLCYKTVVFLQLIKLLVSYSHSHFAPSVCRANI